MPPPTLRSAVSNGPTTDQPSTKPIADQPIDVLDA